MVTTLQASNLFSSSSSSTCCHHGRIFASLHHASQIPSLARLSLPKFPSLKSAEQMMMNTINGGGTTTTIDVVKNDEDSSPSSLVITKLYAIAEEVADRVEMHNNIGEQRNNWNALLLTSINSITLSAAVMAGVAAITGATGAPLLALKFSSSLLYTAATGMLIVMNKIQPSQLAEEQRNAARLFKQLHEQIKTSIVLGNPSVTDVEYMMEKVLALDKAYPLPLLGGVMLDKFPKAVEPAIWWPQGIKLQRQQKFGSKKTGNINGWNGKLEEEMKEIVGVLKRKDIEEYMRLSKLVLKINRILAISGPLVSGVAAIGSAFVGYGSWAVFMSIFGGALASVVNTVEHGGQVGMVFEMYRNCAGFFKLLEESIELTLNQKDLERRENGELFEMKVALQLGRSLCELRDLTERSSSDHRDGNEFASKLF